MTNTITPQAPGAPTVKTAAAPMVVPVKARRRPLGTDRLVAVLMLVPSCIAVALFVYGFIAWNAWASLTGWNDMSITPRVLGMPFPAGDFVGLKNYNRLFGDMLFGGTRVADSRFMADLVNNAIFTVAFLIGCVVLGMVLAILLDQKVKGESFFRNIYLYPMALSFVVTGNVWRWLASAFIVQKEWALPALTLAAVWQMSGFTMAMFLAALRGVPEDLREAARVDGASEAQIYRRIVLPIINPVVLSALIILGHISLKLFDLVFVMTGGSPSLGFATEMPSVYMYELAAHDNQFAKAAAIAMIMLLFVAVVIVPYLVVNLRSENEA